MVISPHDWARAGRRIVHRGHNIFVRVSNSPGGEPLLLIHGFPTSSWDWHAVWPQLAERFHLYAVDMMGFGLSEKPKDYQYSLLDQADLCEAFLAAEGVRSYHVLAHDYGDTVAQELLARHQEPGDRPRLRSVAFLNGGLFPETHRPVLLQRLLLSPIGPLLSRLTSPGAFARNMRKIFGPDTQPDDALIDGFWSLIEVNQGRAVMHRLIRYMVERRQHRGRWVGALQNSLLPLKLIDGALDPISGAHMAARYGELVPRADVTLLDHIGHYPQVEAPTAVITAYFEFRARLDAVGWYEPADPTPKQQCPCCDYVTLPERGNYLICPVCYWEDDGTDLDDLDERSEANHGITLRIGRANFKQCGACEETMVRNVVPVSKRGRFEYRPRDIA